MTISRLNFAVILLSVVVSAYTLGAGLAQHRCVEIILQRVQR